MWLHKPGNGSSILDGVSDQGALPQKPVLLFGPKSKLATPLSMLCSACKSTPCCKGVVGIDKGSKFDEANIPTE